MNGKVDSREPAGRAGAGRPEAYCTAQHLAPQSGVMLVLKRQGGGSQETHELTAEPPCGATCTVCRIACEASTKNWAKSRGRVLFLPTTCFGTFECVFTFSPSPFIHSAHVYRAPAVGRVTFQAVRAAAGSKMDEGGLDPRHQRESRDQR